jgi:acetyl-CoA carboxylase biotin carboxylase subunit
MKRVLVANRGEIAVRVIRACREAGLESVAVHSEPDVAALHVRLADAAVLIGPAQPSASYLNVEALLAAARSTRADAVHPGYGFLAEDAGFARACEDAGLVFIGPSPEVIERMGSKIASRELMADAGVPVVPGATPPDQSDAGITAAARQLGYPLLVKASAGGGGKGMRVVRDAGSLADAVPSARREAASAFGDGTLYLERLIEGARHVEIQVFGDSHGEVVHLFERECSLQRRHQKIIEESPSPALTAVLRERMTGAAVAAARAAGYRNAGTIEFLLEGSGDDARFYFLEMNTRLQVEHPVTEAVTGVDLVRAQLMVAAGDRMPWRQQALTQRGHAIECRIYAEDPASDFLPQAGTLALYREPAGPGIRVDSGVVEGDAVAVNYDPLIAKLVAHAESRPMAIARAREALRAFPVLGIRTNVPFLLQLLDHRRVRTGDIDTAFIDEHVTPAATPAEAPESAIAAAAYVARNGAPGPRAGAGVIGRAAAGSHDPWSTLRGWGR